MHHLPKSTLWIVATVLAVGLPLGYVLHLIPGGGEIPERDYWWIISHFYTIDGFSLNLGDWIHRNNEHLVLIPSLIYALNILITKGSNYGLSLATIGIALGQCLLLITLLPPRQSPVLRWFLILCVALFTFTPAAAHNWMRGFSGAIWMSANFFVITALVCINRVPPRLASSPPKEEPGTLPPSPRETPIWLGASIASGFLAAISYSTSLALWPVLCGLAWVKRLPRSILALYGVATLLACGLYFLTYHTPEHHPSPDLSPGTIGVYILTYLGGIFTMDLSLARILGLLGFGAAIGGWVYCFHPDREHLRQTGLPWLAIQGYILGTALMAAVSRSGFGIEQARSSRYGSLPALFWLAVILITVLVIEDWLRSSRMRPWALSSVMVGVTLLCTGMYTVGQSVAQEIADRAALQPLVMLSLELGAPDPGMVKAAIGNRPEAFLKMVPILKAHHLVPFTRNIRQENPCVVLGSQLETLQDTSVPDIPETLEGELRQTTTLTPSVRRLEGWLNLPLPEGMTCLAIVNQDRVVRGFGFSGFANPDVLQVEGGRGQGSQWKGYAEVLPRDSQLSVYAAVPPGKTWIPLKQANYGVVF